MGWERFYQILFIHAFVRTCFEMANWKATKTVFPDVLLREMFIQLHPSYLEKVPRTWPADK